jgi:hypothetical protein
METNAAAQQVASRVAAVPAARSLLSVVLVESAYLMLRLAAVAILASPIALALYLLLG